MFHPDLLGAMLDAGTTVTTHGGIWRLSMPSWISDPVEVAGRLVDYSGKRTGLLLTWSDYRDGSPTLWRMAEHEMSGDIEGLGSIFRDWGLRVPTRPTALIEYLHGAEVPRRFWAPPQSAPRRERLIYGTTRVLLMPASPARTARGAA